MNVSRRQLFVLGFILVLVGAPATGAMVDYLSDPVQQSGTVTYSVANGPGVAVTGTTNFSGTQLFPDSSTVQYVSDDGNLTVSGAAGTNLSVQASHLSAGTVNYTNLDVAAGPVTISHDQHADLTLEGETDWFEHHQLGVDDGQTDFQYAGSTGSTTVTLRGLPSDTRVGFVDVDSNRVLANGDTGANGQLTATLPNSQHTIELRTSRNEPTLSNPDPVGDLSTPPSQLSIQLNDTDYPYDNHTVEFTLDGETVATTQANQNKTVTASIDASSLEGGQHSWQVRVEDGYGNVVEKGYSFRVPDTLQIRNESSPNQLVNNSTVSVTFFGSDTVVERQTDDGNVSLEDLPVGGRLIVEADATDYHSRTVVLQSLYQQQSIYLLPDNNETETVEVRFVLEDTTGVFGADSTLYIDRVLNQSGEKQYRTIVSDEFGVQGVTTTLVKGDRYQIRIRSQNGETAMLGSYTADVNETVPLQPETASVNVTGPETEIGYSASRSDGELNIQYADPTNQTEYLTVRVYERGNESNVLRPRQTYYDLGNLTLSEPLSPAEQNTTWIVELEGERGGDEISAQVTVGDGPRDLVPDDLDGVWQITIGVFVLLTSALVFSELNLGVGTVSTSLTGGILWWLGLLDGVATGASVVLAIAVSVVYQAVYRR